MTPDTCQTCHATTAEPGTPLDAFVYDLRGLFLWHDCALHKALLDPKSEASRHRRELDRADDFVLGLAATERVYGGGV